MSEEDLLGLVGRPLARATTFLLDPRVLDDTVGDGGKDVGIEAAGLGIMGIRPSFLEYVFFQDKKLFIPDELTRIHHKLEHTHLGSRKLIYQRANVYLSSTSSFPQSVSQGNFNFLYNRGEFLKGDAESLMNYGIKIL